jgi:hypothetical protein
MPGRNGESHAASGAAGGATLLQTVMDALPAMVFVVDRDMVVRKTNATARAFLAGPAPAGPLQRSGDLLRCVHALANQGGCGRGDICRDCTLRGAAAEAFAGKPITRRRVRMTLLRDGVRKELFALVTVSRFEFGSEPLALLVVEDLSELVELHRMIPICSVCKKVRDEKDAWLRIENYFKDHWDLQFTHGLCPECCAAAYQRIAEMERRPRGEP